MNHYQEKARVISQEKIGENIFSLRLYAENIAQNALPGQFIALYCRDESHLLPRPISLCEIHREEGILRLVYRTVGKGTREFSQLVAGDEIEVMGPLGNGFPLQGKKPLLIGGGIGVPPLLALARSLTGEKTLVMGYRRETYLEEELYGEGKLYLATEDGTRGTGGTVLDVLAENTIDADVIYACGPTPMLRAVKRYAEEKNLPAWISMEEKMACGVGACLACVCDSTTVDEHTQVKKKRVCKEGPVFSTKEVEL